MVFWKTDGVFLKKKKNCSRQIERPFGGDLGVVLIPVVAVARSERGVRARPVVRVFASVDGVDARKTASRPNRPRPPVCRHHRFLRRRRSTAGTRRSTSTPKPPRRRRRRRCRRNNRRGRRSRKPRKRVLLQCKQKLSTSSVKNG